MRLILFIHQDSSEKGETLKKAVVQNFYGAEVTTLHTCNALKARFFTPVSETYDDLCEVIKKMTKQEKIKQN
jgi:hypothetical protein